LGFFKRVEQTGLFIEPELDPKSANRVAETFLSVHPSTALGLAIPPLIMHEISCEFLLPWFAGQYCSFSSSSFASRTYPQL
jgi:hypothetical protein